MRKLLITLIFVLAGTNAFAMTFDAGDGKLDVYASMRAFTVFNHTDAGDRAVCGGVAGERNCAQFVIGLQSNSRAGIKWTKGDFFVHNEWAIDAANTNITLRLMYGDYKFAGGKKGRIRIGQIPGTALTASFYDRKLASEQGLQGFGTMMEQRRVGINYAIGGFSISALSMKQDSGAVTNAFSGSGLSNVAFTEIMPRIEASYKISDITVAGTYVKSSIIADNGEDLNRRYHVDAGHIMVAANPKIAGKVRFIASGFYSVNAGMYQMVSIGGGFDHNEAVSRSIWAVPSLKEDGKPDLNNTQVYGGALALTIDNFEAGYGIQSAGNDSWADNQTGMGVYANYKFRISTFSITPEFGYLHGGSYRGDSRVKDTRGLQFGIQFRMDI
jgi:hypothetical protein